MQRLSNRLKMLRAGDASIAAIKADSQADPDGRVLGLMLEWRRQRLRAIELEMQRLEEEADELRDEL